MCEKLFTCILSILNKSIEIQQIESPCCDAAGGLQLSVSADHRFDGAKHEK